MDALAKKLPTVASIVALTAIVMGRGCAQLDALSLNLAIAAIAGLGGFYVYDFIRRRNSG